MSDKELYDYVTAHWSDFHQMTYGRFDICDPEGEMDYKLAYEFTLAHEQAIADLREEIQLLGVIFVKIRTGVMFREGPWVEKDDDTAERIIIREQAALDELLRGWKGTQ